MKSASVKKVLSSLLLALMMLLSLLAACGQHAIQ